jgi:hypothetical protein
MTWLGLCAGCGRGAGPELAAVTGTVTLDGEPLAHANITFVPEGKNGSPSYGGTDADGRYRLLFSHNRAGAMPGKHRVQIEMQPPETDDSGNPVVPTETVQLPAKYRVPGNLTAEVEPGENEIDFELDSSP